MGDLNKTTVIERSESADTNYQGDDMQKCFSEKCTRRNKDYDNGCEAYTTVSDCDKAQLEPIKTASSVPLDVVVMPDLPQICDRFTRVIISSLHWQDHLECNAPNLEKIKHKEMIDLDKVAVERFRNEPRFNKRVESIVAALMTELKA